MLQIGESYVELQNWEDAVKTFSKALDFLPEDATLALKLQNAENELNLGKKREEEKQAEIDRLYDEGMNAYKNQDFKKATELLEKVLNLDPENRKAQRYYQSAKDKIPTEAP